jgi:ATP-dependent Lhr-like helicase
VRARGRTADSRGRFDAVLRMTADGFSTRRGRRAALCTATRSTAGAGAARRRLLAQTSGGAIPEIADYRVILDPDDTFIGTLNEDFAIESERRRHLPARNASWRILQVAPATSASPTPRGAADDPVLARRGAGAERRAVARRSAICGARASTRLRGRGRPTTLRLAGRRERVDAEAAEQIVAYLADGRRALGVVPTQDDAGPRALLRRVGGMQLVLHAPFGSRINKAWGLALRKRFCRQFNFELQAAATEDALMLSLGPQHSFPLADVFRYLHPRRRATCWCRRFSTRLYSKPPGDGTRPSRSPCSTHAGRQQTRRRRCSGMLAADLLADRCFRMPRHASRTSPATVRSPITRSFAQTVQGLPRRGHGPRRPQRRARPASTAASCG